MSIRGDGEAELIACYDCCAATKENAMSKRVSEIPGTGQDTRIWDKQLEELSAEYWTSTELAEEEKRFLDELERLPEEEWEPIACAGKPVSETIIEEREVR